MDRNRSLLKLIRNINHTIMPSSSPWCNLPWLWVCVTLIKREGGHQKTKPRGASLNFSQWPPVTLPHTHGAAVCCLQTESFKSFAGLLILVRVSFPFLHPLLLLCHFHFRLSRLWRGLLFYVQRIKEQLRCLVAKDRQFHRNAWGLHSRSTKVCRFNV